MKIKQPSRGKSERRLRIESQLAAGVAPADIAYVEGVSRQRVHQIKQGLGDDASVKSVMTEPRIGAYSRISRPQRWKRRPSRAFAEWLAAQAQVKEQQA